MQFRIEQFLAGELDAVEGALTDPAFIEELGRLPKLGHPTLLDQRVDGHQVHQRVRYAFAGELSSSVTRFVDPAKLTWVEVSTHDRRTHVAEFRIEPDHYASILSCKGRFVLRPEGTATRRTAEGELKVHIPLVGRKAEQAIVSGLSEHARLEEQFLAQWLLTRPAPGAIPDS